MKDQKRDFTAQWATPVEQTGPGSGDGLNILTFIEGLHFADGDVVL